MPSPFPGMDSYLESPDWFPCLHDTLIVGIMSALQVRLPEFFYARTRHRIWLEHAHRPIEPDAEVLRSGRDPSLWQRGNGGVAVAVDVEVDQPVVIPVETIDGDPFEEPFRHSARAPDRFRQGLR